MFRQWVDDVWPGKAWPGKRAARAQWDAGLAWFRLRYRTPDGPTRCIRLLSRPQACGRVSLYFRPDEAVSALYLGIPETHLRLLLQMAADFDFSVKAKPPDVALPGAQRLTAVANLPWDRPFLAHIVNEFVFVCLADSGHQGEVGHGAGGFLPQPPAKVDRKEACTWQLPHKPAPGLTARPVWRGQPPPARLTASEPDSGRWLLGRSPSGIPLHVSGRVNIYGRQAAAADWLMHLVTQMIARDPTNLIVIDGSGDLVPRLKRKAAITRLLGHQLTYIDIDGASLSNGLNPLAAVPGETNAAQLQRWQHWFGEMNVHPLGLQLLAQAQADGVGDIPALRAWLKQAERHGHLIGRAIGTPSLSRSVQAVSSLRLALTRLTATRSLREWLEWPVNRFDTLPAGALFFACKGTTWQRQQLLRAMLLAARQLSAVRLVVHGYRWQTTAAWHETLPRQTVLSNGPIMDEALPLLVQHSAAGAATIGKRLLNGDRLQMELIQLLRSGEGIILSENGPVLTAW